MIETKSKGKVKTSKSVITMKYEDNADRIKSTMESGSFKKACFNVDLPVTKRQASKWNHKKGMAFKKWNKISM